MLGWLVQRTFARRTTLGAEVYLTAPFDGGATQTQLNAGLIEDLSEGCHLLRSAGPTVGTDARGQGYLALLLTR